MVDDTGGKVDTKSYILPTPSCTGSIQFDRNTRHRRILEDPDFSRLVKIAVKVKFMGLRKAPQSGRVANTVSSTTTSLAQNGPQAVGR
jgi:hypothetical protein